MCEGVVSKREGEGRLSENFPSNEQSNGKRWAVAKGLEGFSDSILGELEPDVLVTLRCNRDFLLLSAKKGMPGN